MAHQIWTLTLVLFPTGPVPVETGLATRRHAASTFHTAASSLFPTGPVPVETGLATRRHAASTFHTAASSLFPTGPVPVETGLATTGATVVIKPVSTDAGSVGTLLNWSPLA